MHKRDRHLFIPRESGSKLPLVCVHGDDANRLLPGLIHPERPFAAFKHQGDGGRRVALDRLDVIAARFLKELEEAGWKPPFALCGYSFGGMIAFEMAQQLVSAGTSQVPLLILIDAYAPSIHEQAMRSDRRSITRLRDAVYGTATRAYLTANLRMPGKIHHHHIISTYNKAIRHYAPARYPGKVLLIKSQEGWGPEDLGWHELVSGGLIANLVPGDHFNIVKPPQIDAVARVIEDNLEAVEVLFKA